MKLNASTAVKIASPGNVPIHQNWKYWVPVATIEPHSARRRLGAEAEEREPGEQQDRVADVERGEHEHRARRRSAARRARARAATDAPSSRDAQTYSESPTERTRLRTTRAYDGHATITSASTAFVSPRPSAAVTTIARMIAGNAKTRSAVRITSPSAKPRK